MFKSKEKITCTDVVCFMLEEVDIPYEIRNDRVYVPSAENCIAGIHIACCESDHTLIFAMTLEIISLYIAHLQDKHESECRQISAYDLENRKLKTKCKAKVHRLRKQ